MRVAQLFLQGRLLAMLVVPKRLGPGGSIGRRNLNGCPAWRFGRFSWSSVLAVFLRHASLLGDTRQGAGRTLTRLVLAGALYALVVCGQLVGHAEELPGEASSSFRSRQEAIRAIPFDRIRPAVGQKLRKVIEDPTMYRRLPIQIVDADPDLYILLARYPEVIVNMWQLMGVTQLQLERTGDYTMRVVDGAGTTGNLELVYGTHDVHVYYAVGHYEGPLLKQRIVGRCVAVLSTGFTETDQGRIYVSSRLDVFARLDNPAADLVAKTLYPLMGKASDRNFLETNRFVGEVSRAAETQWAGLQQLCPRLTKIRPDVQARFRTTAAKVRVHAQQRMRGLGDAQTTSTTTEGVRVSRRVSEP